ncbi:nuclear transport factor 2 family protein [Caulobacter sp.]|uniref:nuclear transport factor 2 family protein n=1 Tax=Caulobacter sp. TaxID=78 RepID=UPI0031DD417F
MIRPLIFALALLAPLAAQAQTQTQTPAGLDKTLDALHAAAAKADGKTYFSLWTPGAVFIGTDAGERWTIEQFKAAFGPWFDKGEGFTYVPRERHLDMVPAPCGCVAVFDEILDSPKYGVTRDSGVAVRGEDGTWRLVQYHLTLPIPDALTDKLTAEIKAYLANKHP